MLSEKEIAFLQYWEASREQESKIAHKLLKGLPMAILFGVPILLSVALVYFLSPDWYTKISQKVPGVIVPLLLAVILSIVFFSFGRMHFKWEMNEQLYKELKMKKEQEESNAANQVKN